MRGLFSFFFFGKIGKMEKSPFSHPPFPILPTFRGSECEKPPRSNSFNRTLGQPRGGLRGGGANEVRFGGEREGGVGMGRGLDGEVGRGREKNTGKSFLFILMQSNSHSGALLLPSPLFLFFFFFFFLFC